MRLSIFFAVFCLCFWTGAISFAQVQLSGIVNFFSDVTVFDTCSNSLALSTPAGFDEGQDVILIQMQGAKVRETNSSTFGEITDLGSAGKFEVNTISRKNGTQIFLANKILNSYDLNAGFQIVTFPKFLSATVSDTLFAEPWNGKTGGIFALNIEGELRMNAPIVVSGMGFRGGKAISFSNNCLGGFNSATAYFYDNTNWRGAEKGEAIAQKITGKEAGRGAMANGGGGGNDHNSGGGGGANLAAGGDGGDRQTSFLTGDCKGENPGKAGRNIQNIADRIYLGGGGGAGHGNNNLASDGGNGGGIVILFADKISGASTQILANGQNARNSKGDGGGGGGAGGTVLLKLGQANPDLQIEATGGNGGIVDNGETAECFGPGGGGAGGVIHSNQNNFQRKLPGGKAGKTTNTTNNCNNSTNGADAGQDGIFVNNLSVPASSTPGAGLSILNQPPSALQGCEGAPLELKVIFSGIARQLEWEVNTGGGYVPIAEGADFQGVKTETLKLPVLKADIHDKIYRLKMTGLCGEVLTSGEVTVAIIEKPIAAFDFLQNGLSFQFTNQSTDATQFLWNFGDGETSQEQNPVHSFSQEGSFIVALRSSSVCGTAVFSTVVQAGLPPEAEFRTEKTKGCPPHRIEFFDASSGTILSHEWQFPGGIPAASSDLNPVVTYSITGVYDVVLIVRNNIGADTFLSKNLVEIYPQPIAGFDFSVQNRQVQFFNQSIDADRFVWQFGDNSAPSVERDPVHVYTAPGVYFVSLNALNSRCGASISRTVGIETTSTQVVENEPLVVVFPNPTRQFLNLQLQNLQPEDLSVKIYDAAGQYIFRQAFSEPGMHRLDVQQFPAGLYLLKIESESATFATRFVKI